MQEIQVNEGAFLYYARLRRVKEHIGLNYSEEMSLDKAARIAATEKTYFSTFFRKKVGITFTDWLRRIRVAKAIDIMKTRNQSICDIAFEVGFGDLRSFERAFKRSTNLTLLMTECSCRYDALQKEISAVSPADSISQRRRLKFLN